MFLFIFLLFINIIFSTSTCTVGKNHCKRCNLLNKLCDKCDNKDIYIPDEAGGCIKAHKCILGLNKCDECDETGYSCKKCQDGLFPDENGGCSYSGNCEISYKGECLQCKKDFILIGRQSYYHEKEIKICKSINSDDLKNCLEINTEIGICEKCKEGFYLNYEDKKCSTIENCFESIFDVCIKCNNSYYFDKRESICKNKTDNLKFEHCKQTIDGEACDICDDDYYLDEDGKCIYVNHCLQANENFRCIKCAPGYFPNKYNSSCVTTKNCVQGDKDIGICILCEEGFYIDYKDGICKSNEELNKFQYCHIAEGNECLDCIGAYELGEDNKCSNTKHCVESYNGTCLACSDDYHLGLDNKCCNVENCIYSENNNCYECEDGYYYNFINKTCDVADGNFKNCRSGNINDCEVCKDDFYFNYSDYLCYSNKENNNFYKCEETDYEGKYCEICVPGYYLGEKDFKCSKVEACALSENENRCLECEDYFYCLNQKTGQCEINYDIISEEKKFYWMCNKTNSEGTACENCLDNYVLDENGLCINMEHCIDKNEDGTCRECVNNVTERYCLNQYFGCVYHYKRFCSECNNIFDFFNCTKCFEGYQLNEEGDCIEIIE